MSIGGLHYDAISTHLDSSFDRLEALRAESVSGRSLDKLEVTESSEFASKVLKGFVRLVDDENIEEDVEALHVDVGFGINRI